MGWSQDPLQNPHLAHLTLQLLQPLLSPYQALLGARLLLPQHPLLLSKLVLLLLQLPGVGAGEVSVHAMPQAPAPRELTTPPCLPQWV